MRLVEHRECFNLPMARDVFSVLREHLLDDAAVMTQFIHSTISSRVGSNTNKRMV
jgi:hypothetical protein